jgi:hypothetical protein
MMIAMSTIAVMKPEMNFSMKKFLRHFAVVAALFSNAFRLSRAETGRLLLWIAAAPERLAMTRA